MFSAAILATVLVYTWVVAPIAPRWTAAAAAAIVLALAVAHALRTREWGVAPRTLAPSLAQAAIFTAAATAGLALAGWRLQTWHSRLDPWGDLAVLVPWALGQQFALQTVLLRDAQRLTTPRG